MPCAFGKAWAAFLLARTPGDDSRIVGKQELIRILPDDPPSISKQYAPYRYRDLGKSLL